MKTIVALLMVFLVTGRVEAGAIPDLKTVEKVDLSRYLGLWYEIASLPQWFQKNCYGTTAEYAMVAGEIEVVNRCNKGSLQGRESKAVGKAWVVDPSNAKLKVQFFWPFRGDYWIIELDENYQYAVVGSPKRKSLWILSRTPKMDEALYADLIERIKTKHHYQNLEQLRKTEQ